MNIVAQRQKGIATLLFVVVMIALVSSLTFFSARSASVGQRSSANAVKTNHAYEAAYMGLRAAISKLDMAGLSTAMGGNTVYTTAPVTSDTGNYTITYNKIGADFSKVKVTAVGGCQFDSNVRQQFSQVLKFSPYVYNKPVGSVVAKGTATVSGSARLVATDSNVTSWTGGSAMIGGANAQITGGSGGIYASDANLAALNADQFFTNTFSEKKDVMRTYGTRITCPVGGCKDNDITNRLTGSEAMVFIDGDLAISGNTTIGSATNPVTLVVSGKMSMNHNQAQINGIVYTEGNWDNQNGKGTINGSVIVNGNFTSTGGLTINHSQTILSNLDQRGVYAPVEGSWLE